MMTSPHRLLTCLFAAIGLSACSPEAPSPSPQPTAPVKTMHPSWDADNDGINDCEKEASCDHTIDYSQPRPASNTHAQPAHHSACGHAKPNSLGALHCQHPIIAELNQRTIQTYNAAHTHNPLPTLDAEQRHWRKELETCTEDSDPVACLKLRYQQRTAELQVAHQLVNHTQVNFTCSDGSQLQASFYTSDIPALRLVRAGESAVLYQAIAASGAKYQGANQLFWEHQGEAQVQWGDSEFTCKAAH